MMSLTLSSMMKIRLPPLTWLTTCCLSCSCHWAAVSDVVGWKIGSSSSSGDLRNRQRRGVEADAAAEAAERQPGDRLQHERHVGPQVPLEESALAEADQDLDAQVAELESTVDAGVEDGAGEVRLAVVEDVALVVELDDAAGDRPLDATGEEVARDADGEAVEGDDRELTVGQAVRVDDHVVHAAAERQRADRAGDAGGQGDR